MEVEMDLRKGVLRSFDSGSYTAAVQLSGSHKGWLENIAVARNIPSAEMISGRKVAVILFDVNNAKEAVVTAVYS
jgi:hypothetical protein